MHIIANEEKNTDVLAEIPLLTESVFFLNFFILYF